MKSSFFKTLHILLKLINSSSLKAHNNQRETLSTNYTHNSIFNYIVRFHFKLKNQFQTK
jgi:hypothetical protein